jgi:MFS superfamily sulfate permease-like transporter
VFAAVTPLVAHGASPSERLAFAAMLALLMGALCVIAGILRLGVLGELLSKPMRIGYLNGIAVVVFVRQLPKLFGFSTDADGVVDELHAFVDGVLDGATNSASLTIGVACLAVIVVLRHWGPLAPGVLVAVVGATVAVSIFDLADEGVAVVGAVPQGLLRPDPVSASTTRPRFSPLRSGWHSSPSPTPSRCPAPSRLGATWWTPTRRSWRSGPPTSPLASSRDSP